MKLITLQLLIRSLKGVIAALEMEYEEKKDKFKKEDIEKYAINHQSD